MNEQSSDLVGQWSEVTSSLDQELLVLEERLSDPVKRAEDGIFKCIRTLTTLEHTIEKRKITDHEAIVFYKVIRPGCLSKLHYFQHLFRIEVARPPAGRERIVRYYSECARDIEVITLRHDFLNQYTRSGATHLDQDLFFRPSDGSLQSTFGFLSPAPQTGGPQCYDFALGELLGAQKTLVYIQKTLENLSSGGPVPGNASGLRWTESKTGLIELAYALHATGAFNYGKTDLKDIIELLQVAFSIHLGNYPRTFQEILSRKKGYTNMLDKLRDKLLLRIESIEDKF